MGSGKQPPGGIAPQLHVDEVRYVVRLTPHPAAGAEGVTEGFAVWWSEMDVSLDDATRFSTAVAWDASHRVYEAHVASQTFTRMEWGASAYALSFLIDLANNVSAEAVVGGMAYAVGKMRGKKRRPIAWTPRSGLADDVHVAKRTVEAVFDEKYDDIAVEESLVVGEHLRIVLKGTFGGYVATLTSLPDTGDPICHVARDNAAE